MWCVAELNDEYIERMEDVLDTYAKKYDPKEPVVCLDEKPVQMIRDTRPSTSPSCGKIAKQDYEYERKGMANVFIAVEPLKGQYIAKVTSDRTSPEFAMMLADIIVRYPKAQKIHLVMDNLSTHTKDAVVSSYGEKLGSKIWNRFEVHYTPKHASWLNQAEIAISMYAGQCLGKRRIGDIEILRAETKAWNKEINTQGAIIDWKFTKKKARKKFKY